MIDPPADRQDRGEWRIEPADGLHRTRPYSDPDLHQEYDEDGDPIPGTRFAGWDVSFGCRMNFGPDPEGRLRISVHVSDQAKRAGLAVSPTTPSQLRQLARALMTVANENDLQSVERPGGAS
jgi:hypothetical protein